MPRRYRAQGIVVILVSLSVSALMMREPALLTIGDLLTVRDELQPADVIHVISGPDHRTDYGIRLYQAGYGKRIFFTGGWCSTIKGNHAERGRERALRQGVPPEAIAIDGSWVTSTYSEAVRLQEFITESSTPIRSVIVVSDPYHMRRARWTYGHVMGKEMNLLMAPVPLDLSPYQRQWWTDQASRQNVWSEYLKIAYYHLRYDISSGPVRAWLASLDRD